MATTRSKKSDGAARLPSDLPREIRRPLRRLFSDEDRAELRRLGFTEEPTLIAVEHACVIARAQGWFKDDFVRPKRSEITDNLARIELLAKKLHGSLAGAPSTNAMDVWSAAGIEIEQDEFLAVLEALSAGAATVGKRAQKYKDTGAQPLQPIQLIARALGSEVTHPFGRDFLRVLQVCYRAMGARDEQMPSRRTIAKALARP